VTENKSAEDIVSGKDFLMKAAAKGDSDSLVRLGDLAAEGIGDQKRKKDLKAAFEFYK
jgi:TPR repeat protein